MHKILAVTATAILALTTGVVSASASVARHTTYDASTKLAVAANPAHLYYLARKSANDRLEVFQASQLHAALTERISQTLGRPGAFDWIPRRHPWYHLVKLPRLRELRAARAAAAAANPPAGPGTGAVAAAHLSATGFEGCVMAAESGGVSTAWYPGHTDGSLPPPDSPVAEGLFGFLLSTWRGLNLGWSQGASYAPAKVQIQGFWKLYDSQGETPWTGDGCVGATTATTSASLMSFVTTMHHRRHCHHRRDHARWLRWIMRKALAWARTQRGKPYCWSGTGPRCYDCSGLVMTAFRHAGFWLPRTTYEMQDSPRLRQVRRPRPGDIVLYGWPAYHAAIYAGHHRIFDALNQDTPVGSQPMDWPGTPIFYQLA